MWNLHSLCAAYGQRPSTILDIEDVWGAYQFDLVVVQFGLWVEGKLSARDDKGRPKHTIEQLLAEDGEKPKQYAKLGGLVSRKIVIPESGVWDDAS